jgi:putative oxidoreductase
MTDRNRWARLFRADAHPAVLLIRLAVGFTFLVAGSRKLMDLEQAGSNFGNMGFPQPHFLAGMVAGFEVLCALLILVGLATRLAAIPLIVIMIMAIISTKLPTLVGGTVGPFGPPSGPASVSNFLNAARLDVSMLLSASFLAWVGAGPWSVDRKFPPR